MPEGRGVCDCRALSLGDQIAIEGVRGWERRCWGHRDQVAVGVFLV